MRIAVSIILVVFCWWGVPNSQAQLRVVTYNALFPTNEDMTTVLRALGDQAKAGFSSPIDILLLQEQDRSFNNVRAIVDTLNEIYAPGTYAYAEDRASQRDTSNYQMVIYRTDSVELIGSAQATESLPGTDSGTPPRATMRYQFRPAGYGEEADFYVYNSHLRASTGTANAAEREWEVAQIRADADALGEGVRAIYVGDLNIYSPTEQAMQNFLATGYGQAFDPLMPAGGWGSAGWGGANNLDLHTQSPVSSDDAVGGQVGGGMDDRFDFQLMTEPVFGGRGFSYIQDSYWAFGNTGTHVFDQSLDSGGTNSFAALQALFPGYTLEQAEAVLLALMATSDHIPVVADYRLPARMGVVAEEVLPAVVIRGAEVAGSFMVTNTAPVAVQIGADRLDYTFIGAGGVVATGGGSTLALSGGNVHEFTLDTGTVGARTGTLAVEATSPQAALPYFSATTSFGVLDYARPSFSAGAAVTSFDIDFGSVDLLGAPATSSFTVHNLASEFGAIWTARLDLLGWTVVNAEGTPEGVFQDTLAGFSNMAANGSQTFSVTLNPGSIGQFSGSYLLHLRDEELPGATTHTLSLNLFGLVVAANATMEVFDVTAGFSSSDGGLLGETGLSKTGAGTLSITGANTYSGNTLVNEGRLVLAGTNGAAAGLSSYLRVAAGSELVLGAAQQVADTAYLHVAGGTFDTSTFAEGLGRVRLSDGGIITGTGTLTAGTYELVSGTVQGALGAGEAQVTGAVTLQGTAGSTLLSVLAAGNLSLGSSERITNTASVLVNGGTFHLGGHNETVGLLVLTNGGNVTGVGTLTASSYALQGGTVNARLGAGVVTAGAGVTTLSNEVAAASVVVSGGVLRLGGNGLLSGGAHVQVTGGTFDVQSFTNTVGTLTLSGGVLGGAGQLTAAEYNLQSGAVAARLGAGAANVSGAVQLASPGRLHEAATLTVASGGSLSLAGNETVGTVQLQGGTINGMGTLAAAAYDLQDGALAASLSGSGTLTKSGMGTVHLTRAAAGYTGAVGVHDGVLRVSHSQALGSAAVEMFDGALLAGVGVVVANNFTVGQLGSLVTNAFTSVTVAGWDFNGLTNYGPSPMSATTVAAGITIVDGLTRGPGVGLSGTGGSGSWGGSTWSTNSTAAQAVTDGKYAYFTLGVNEGFVLNLSAVDQYNIRRSQTGPTTGLWEYAVGDGTFASLTNPISWGTNTASGGNLQTAIGLEGLQTLQTLSAGSTVTFRVANYNAGTNTGGTWYFNNFRTGDDLRLLGEIAGVVQGDEPPTGGGMLGSDTVGLVTFAGNVRINSSVDLTAAAGGRVFFDGVLSGLGDMRKVGAGTVTLSGANTFVGGVRLQEGTLRLAHSSAAGLGEILQTSGQSVLEIDTLADIANNMSVYNLAFLQSGRLSGHLRLNNATFFVADEETSTLSGVLTSEEGGEGGVTKTGAGRLVLTGNNTYIGPTDVQVGILELATVGGSAAGTTGSVSVASGATLLLSQSDQVNNSAAVSFSGGTIQRGSGVSEVFGSLSVTTDSFLDFGTGDVGMVSFGTYTPSALLTVNNFGLGNVLTFGSNLTGSISNGSFFAFDNGFTSSWDSGTSTFTITAIPEPSTYVAAAGLIALMIWPIRRRLLRGCVKLVLGQGRCALKRRVVGVNG